MTKSKKETDKLYEKAEILGIKKENLDKGMKVNPKGMEDMINKASKFMRKK